MRTRLFLIAFILHINNIFACCMLPSDIETQLRLFYMDTVSNGSLIVSLKAVSDQKKSDTGLRFSILITNKSSTEIRISNPLDKFIINLYNDKHVDVMYSQAPKYLVNTKVPFKYTSFLVSKVTVNGKSVPIILDNERFISIPSYSDYEIALNIPKIRKGDIQSGNNATIPVPKGVYTLKAIVGIVKDKRMEKVRPEPLVIHYGY